MNIFDTKFTDGHVAKELMKEASADVGRLAESADEATAKLSEATAEVSETGVKTIKKFPMHTALAAGAVGFLLGAFFKKRKSP